MQNRTAPFLIPILLLGLSYSQSVFAAGAGSSNAVTPEIVDALQKEITRSMKNLKLGGAKDPYFISYKITEVEVNDIAASLGATTSDRERHFVVLEAHVHVGTFQFDNSNFVFPRRESVDGIAQIALPLEATPKLARRSAWIATDAAYKEALEQLRAKQDALRSGASGGESNIPSYSKSPAVQKLDPIAVPKLENLESMRKRAKALSTSFKGQPWVRDSRVAFTSFLERRWLLNSEGTKAHDTRRVSGVALVATGQANDGQEIAQFFTEYGETSADLPGDKELKKQAKRLSKQLKQLAAAPLVDSYTGPVLFEGEGAVGMVEHSLARHLSGTPLPVGLSDQDSLRFGGELVNRIGLRVAAPSLTITDDPTVSKWKKTHLIGGYRMDDEGVASQRVDVIKAGKLRSLLMSRTPSKGIKSSNGHARLSMPGGIFRGSTTNLFIKGKGGVPKKTLRKKLLKEVKEQGLPYGIVITQFDDPALTMSDELSRFRLFQLLSTLDRNAPPIAATAYRLFPNGKTELVRGVQLRPIRVRAWKDILAVSKEQTVKNFLHSTDDPFLIRLAGGGDGYAPSSGIESSVVTPNFLFEELDIKPSAAGRRQKPAVPPPSAR